MKTKVFNFVRGLRNGTLPRFQSYFKSILMVVALLSLSSNVWGASVTFGSDWNSLFGTSYDGTINGVKANSLTLEGTVSNVSFVVTNGSSTNGYVKTDDFRAYNGYTITITAPTNNNITAISSTKGGKNFSSGVSANVGTLSISNNAISWSGSSNSVVLSISGTVSFATIAVTYSGSTPPTPATHYTVSFYNNGVKVGEATTETYEDNGKEYLNEEDLPDMSSASFPHPTSKAFAGWITDEITTPATSIDYHHFIDQNTAITEDCSVNALWGTTTGGSTATFNANDASNLSETSGSGYHQWADKSTGIAMGGDDAQHFTSGSPKTFTIKSASGVWNTVYFDGDDKVIAQYVVTASTTSYGISDPAHGDISSSGAVYTVTNVNANYTYAYTNNEDTKNQQIRITNAVVTCYTGYITHYTACTPAGTALAVSASPTSITTSETSTLSTTDGNGGTVTYSVTSANASSASIVGTTFSATAVGTYTVTAHQDMNGAVCEQNATVNIEVTPERHQVRWHVGTDVTTDNVAEGAAITFPADPSSALAGCEGKSFYGWAKNAIDGETDDEPTVYTSETMSTADIDFYAVFADKEGEGENGWEKVTTVAGFTPGTYVFGYESNDGFIPMRKETDKTTINVNTYLRAGTTAGSSSASTLSLTAETDVTAYAVTIGAGSAEGTITIHNGTNYIGVGSSSGSIHNEETAEDWKPEISNEVLILKHNTSNTYIFSYNTSSPRFAAYTSSQGKPSFYKWTSNTSYSAFVTTCKACESEVTVTKSACENGSFTVSKETVCADDAGGSVTVTCTPNEHYHVSAVTATVGSVTGSENSYTVSGITAATEIAVTFAIDQQITVTWNVNGTETPQLLWPGEHVTALPEAPTVMPICANTFMGWSTSTLVGEEHDAPTDLFNKIEDLPEITGDVTFNAVFAQGEGTPESWRRVTSLSEITAGKYVIKNGGFVLPNTTVSSGAPVATTAPTVTDDVMTGTVANSIQWNFIATGTANQFTIQSVADNDNYLYAIKDNKGVRVTNNATDFKDDAWTFAVHTENEEGFCMQSKNESRFCAVRYVNSAYDWASYTTKDYINTSSSPASGYTTNNGKLELYKYSGGATYSNYVTTCATYTVTWRSNDYEIRVDADKAPGTVLTAPTVSEVRTVNTKAACGDHLVGWVPAASTTNPKVKQDTAPAGMVGQQVTVTDNVVYHAVYADVAGE